MADIGFIGLGNMDGPMAKNPVAAGHEVIGFDVDVAQEDVAHAGLFGQHAGRARAGGPLGAQPVDGSRSANVIQSPLVAALVFVKHGEVAEVPGDTVAHGAARFANVPFGSQTDVLETHPSPTS